MDNFKITKYSIQYQITVKEFVIAAHEEFGFPYNSWWDGDLEDPEAFYIKSGGIFYILLDGSKLIGTVAVKNRDNGIGELKRLYLDKEYRGRKIGLKLYNLAVDFAKENNFKKITLSTNKKQAEAIKLYKRNGFTVDETKGNVLYMSKIL